MKKHKLFYFVISLIIIFIFIGYYYYIQPEEVNNIEKNSEEIQKHLKTQEKTVYEKHDGQLLVYTPVGDSIASGAHASTLEKRYISILSNLIQKKMGYEIQITNDFVIPGTGLKDNGIPNITEIVATKPDFITLGFGTNDLSEDTIEAYSTPLEFERRLEYMVNQLLSQLDDTKILLVTTWRNGEDSLIYDDIIKNIGKKYDVPVVDISKVWKDRDDTVGPSGVQTPFGLSDNWHPNDLGHSLIANEIFEEAYLILK